MRMWDALGMLAVAAPFAVPAFAPPPPAPIHFSHRELPFRVENCETSRRHAPETMAGGVATFDYDRDGDLDLFFTNGADIVTLRKSDAKYANRLFANDGKGNFTDVTTKAGLTGTGYDMGAAVADYDNDGFQDLFVGGVHRNTLYHNNGDGTFRDVTAESGLATTDDKLGPLWSVGAAWIDFNSDGLLDLFVINYLSWEREKEPLCEADGHPEYCHPRFYKGTPSQLFLNKGGGTFSDVSGRVGLRSLIGKGMGAGVADYDGDGWPDIFVTNDKLYNFLLHNRDGKMVEEVAFEKGVALAESGNPISGMGADFRDLNNDGYPDAVLVALENETFPLYRNTGKGMFRDITGSSGLAALSKAMAGYSVGIFDFDNDGWKDIFVTRGHVQSELMRSRFEIEQINVVFRNMDSSRLESLTEAAGFAAAAPKRHRGSAWGDFDGDGRLDVAVSALGAPAELWMNDSPDRNHWLELALEGTKSNRDGIGARVKVVTAGETQYNHSTSCVGYASSSAGPVHFGLGQHQTVGTVEIRWPSGAVQVLKSVEGGRVLKVREPG